MQVHTKHSRLVGRFWKAQAKHPGLNFCKLIVSNMIKNLFPILQCKVLSWIQHKLKGVSSLVRITRTSQDILTLFKTLMSNYANIIYIDLCPPHMHWWWNGLKKIHLFLQLVMNAKQYHKSHTHQVSSLFLTSNHDEMPQDLSSILKD